MPDIKVKDIAKGTVKAIDKSAIAAQRMKNAYIRTKEKAEHSAGAAGGFAGRICGRPRFRRFGFSAKGCTRI